MGNDYDKYRIRTEMPLLRVQPFAVAYLRSVTVSRLLSVNRLSPWSAAVIFLLSVNGPTLTSAAVASLRSAAVAFLLSVNRLSLGQQL